MALLSILIPTMPERAAMFNELMEEIYYQKQSFDVEVVIDSSPSGDTSIGRKRNDLMTRSTGEYVCFIDDDDMISKDYISDIMKALESKPDCVSLRGVITWDGQNPEIFEHSIKYKEYKETDNSIKYERYPNHLNVIKASIAKQFKFPKVNWGEDTDWATQINASGLLKTEHYIDQIIYYYDYKTTK